MFAQYERGNNMQEVEYKATITLDAETKEAIDSIIRINLPEDYPDFGELINIACCYNADVEYVGKELVVKVCNKELVNEICKDYYMYLLG